MQKQMIFIVTAVTLLTAVATAAALYTLNEVNAQTNMTNNTGGNTTGVEVSKVITPAGATIGKIERINNTSSGGGNMTNATQ
jgi:hypothetical protein